MSLFAKIKGVAFGNVVAGIISLGALSLSGYKLGPESFGTFGFAVSMIAILSSMASFRFDTFICQPKVASKARAYSVIALLLCFVFSVVTFIALFFLELPIFNDENKLFLICSISLAVFFTAINQVAVSWALFKKEYSMISKVKIVQASVGAIVQVYLIYILNMDFVALILGFAISQSGGFLTLFYKAEFFRGNVYSKKYILFRVKYKNALYSSLSYFVAIMSPMLPSIILNSKFGAYEAGVFFFAYQLASTPFSYLRRILSYITQGEFNQGESPLAKIILYLKGKKKHAICFFMMTVSFSLFAPSIFGYIFGNEWKESGYVFLALIVLFVVDTVFYSCFQVLNLRDKQKKLFCIEVLRLSILLLGVFLLELNFWFFVVGYVFIMVTFHLITILTLYFEDKAFFNA